MIKYVDDLTKVRPDEIEHVEDKNITILAIIHCPNVSEKSKEMVVVYSNGDHASYFRNGSYLFVDNPHFIFKSK